MDAYATYEFYTDTYHGDALTEALFTKWEARAEDRLNFMTFHRIDEDVAEEYTTEIAKATCALAEVLFNLDYATTNATDPEKGDVKSKSSGGESVSFGSTETVYTAAMADAQKKAMLERDAVAVYLADTGLLYSGASGI